ncbi:MAG: acetylornithine deacetylase [Pseudomonadota bacterium]
MTNPLDSILDVLRPLIEAESCNPPRRVTTDGPLIKAIRSALPDFTIDVRDIDEGCLIIDCVRGAPRVMFNVHVDTVPVADGWTHPPHALTLSDDRAFGLGTCDTKGAAGVLMALSQHTDKPMRMLFNTDEEAGKSRCIRTFLETVPDVDLAVVAEPTDTLVRLEHRGICSVHASFSGESAHASEGARRSAVHDAAKFITDALGTGIAAENRLNFGRIEGGVKPNMVAAHADLLFGFRTAPGYAHTDVLDVLAALDTSPEMTTRFVGPSFPSDADGISSQAVAAAARYAKKLDLPIGDPVAFWTEASLFAAAGVPTFVLGAGSITQAHNADEFVTYEQLTTLYHQYQDIVNSDGQ